MSQQLLDTASQHSVGVPGRHTVDPVAVAIVGLGIVTGAIMGALPGHQWLFGWPELLIVWSIVAGFCGGVILVLFHFVPLLFLLVVFSLTLFLSKPYLGDFEHLRLRLAMGSCLVAYATWLTVRRRKELLTAVHRGMRLGFGLAVTAAVYRIGCQISVSQPDSWQGGVLGAVYGGTIGLLAGFLGGATADLLRRMREDGT